MVAHAYKCLFNLLCQISKMSVYKECNLLKTGTTVTLTNQKFDDLFPSTKSEIRNNLDLCDHEMILRRLRC